MQAEDAVAVAQQHAEVELRVVAAGAAQKGEAVERDEAAARADVGGGELESALELGWAPYAHAAQQER